MGAANALLEKGSTNQVSNDLAANEQDGAELTGKTSREYNCFPWGRGQHGQLWEFDTIITDGATDEVSVCQRWELDTNLPRLIKLETTRTARTGRVNYYI